MSAKEPPKTDHERRRGTTNADGELFADGVYPLLERRTDKSSARRLSCTQSSHKQASKQASKQAITFTLVISATQPPVP